VYRPPIVRPALALFVLVAAALSAPRASAWSERSVQSSTVWLTLERDGSARVEHQLVVDIRGERLKAFSVAGVDRDAVPLPDASLVRTDGSRATSSPLALGLEVAADVATLRVPLKQGMSGRTFNLRFGYRTELYERGLLRRLPGGERIELSWLGPRFDNGVDSATLIVRAPTGTLPPAAVEEPNADEPGAHANYGMLVSTLRRSNAQDELELVRAHIASGEAMLWRVVLDADVFQRATSETASEDAAQSAEEPAEAASLLSEAPPEPRPLRELGLAFALGLAYALLVWLKSYEVARAAALCQVRPRALVPWPLLARVLGSGVALGGAATLVAVWEEPIAAALLLVLAMVLASQRNPEVHEEPRGPGSWRALGNEAFAGKPLLAPPGAWLDAGRVQGFLLLGGLLFAWGSLAATWYLTSPYTGACALIGAASLLPIFCTGRAAELPLDALAQSRRFLRRLSRRLNRHAHLSVTPLGRFGDGDGQLDELRLLLQPARSLPGLLALEVALEQRPALGVAGATPVLLLRAADGSPCYRSLPRELTWTRGRTSEERVSLIYPRWPSLSVCEALVAQLLPLVSAPEPEPRKSAARSAGSSLSTAKAAT
jgi:hypothetical protein